MLARETPYTQLFMMLEHSYARTSLRGEQLQRSPKAEDRGRVQLVRDVVAILNARIAGDDMSVAVAHVGGVETTIHEGRPTARTSCSSSCGLRWGMETSYLPSDTLFPRTALVICPAHVHGYGSASPSGRVWRIDMWGPRLRGTGLRDRFEGLVRRLHNVRPTLSGVHCCSV